MRPPSSKRSARSLDDAKEWLAAKLVGRWRNGSPLVMSPDAPDPKTSDATDFGYSDDTAGLRCPFSAHSRVANPRDEPTFPDTDTPVPRISRRGAPYGAPPVPPDYSGERGLIGLFLCGSLVNQFEKLYTWINTNDFSERVFQSHPGRPARQPDPAGHRQQQRQRPVVHDSAPERQPDRDSDHAAVPGDARDGVLFAAQHRDAAAACRDGEVEAGRTRYRRTASSRKRCVIGESGSASGAIAVKWFAPGTSAKRVSIPA